MSSQTFHIHPVTGTPAHCRAERGYCPFGSREEHFETKASARLAFERLMEAELEKTHEIDPLVSEKVQELLSYHIAKIEDPDARELLIRTEKRLTSAASVVALNRYEALYLNAALELDEDDNLAEASDFVGLVAHELKEHYRKFRPSVIDEATLLNEYYIEEAREELFSKLRLLRERELNSELLHSEESGIVETESYKVAIVRDMTALETLGEHIRNTNEEDYYIGSASECKDNKTHEQLEEYALRLIHSFSVANEFHAPKPMSPDDLPDGFVLLSAGQESNVYLHRDSETVYKIPHCENIERAQDASPAKQPEREYLNAVVFSAEVAYAKIDREKLKHNHGAEYLSTYFLNLKDNAGKPVGVIVQPYLDPERYISYQVTSEEKYNMQEAGVSDIHDGNVLLDQKTGRLVLFDCLFRL